VSSKNKSHQVHTRVGCYNHFNTDSTSLSIFSIDFHVVSLDLVLRKPSSGLTTFWTSTGWSKMESLGRDEIADLTYFAGYVDPARGSLGFL
jgi:hypothetical protein